jgi:NAD(P)H-hydrate epimerase
MAGAIALSGQAALRSGAGLVTIATGSSCADVVAGFEASYMTIPLAETSDGELDVAGAIQRIQEFPADAIGCGPGMGTSPSREEIVVRLYRESPRPLVIDADGLNLLAKHRVALQYSAGPRILTPHPGEFRRLAPDIEGDSSDARGAAPAWAAKNRVVLVLKGHRTLVTDGEQCYENTTGNPGMATGGTGDVLTGVVTSLLGQGLTPFQAAQLATYVHGLAGDFAAAHRGQIGMIASDLLEWLPVAMNQSLGR